MSTARTADAAPQTDCDECWQAETTWRQKARAALHRESPFMAYSRSMGEVTMIMMGGHPPSWYERHRDKWAATGDLAELERMLRHVR